MKGRKILNSEDSCTQTVAHCRCWIPALLRFSCFFPPRLHLCCTCSTLLPLQTEQQDEIRAQRAVTLAHFSSFASFPTLFSQGSHGDTTQRCHGCFLLSLHCDTILQETFVILLFLMLWCTNPVLKEPSSSASCSPRATNKAASSLHGALRVVVSVSKPCMSASAPRPKPQHGS